MDNYFALGAGLFCMVGAAIVSVIIRRRILKYSADHMNDRSPNTIRTDDGGNIMYPPRGIIIDAIGDREWNGIYSASSRRPEIILRDSHNDANPPLFDMAINMPSPSPYLFAVPSAAENDQLPSYDQIMTKSSNPTDSIQYV